MDPPSSQSSTLTRASTGPEAFTFGAHPLPRARRAWDRAPRSPRKRHLKGTKVWKRQRRSSSSAAAQDRDELASAQLLGDLAASTHAHAAKRLRVQHMPAIPASMQTQPTYAPAGADGSPQKLRRKAVLARVGRQSPAKSALRDPWLSPRRAGTRRRSSVRAAASAVTSHVDEEKVVDQGRSIEEEADQVSKVEEYTQPLLGIDLSGSKFFDEDHTEEVSRISESESEDESIVDEPEATDEESELSHEEDEVLEYASEEDETARLLDAGNTGVVLLPQETTDEQETDLLDDDEEQVEDESTLRGSALHEELQINVTELLTTPPKGNAPDVDQTVATPSPATENKTTEPLHHAVEAAPDLFRDETASTGSTIEFDEATSVAYVRGFESRGEAAARLAQAEAEGVAQLHAEGDQDLLNGEFEEVMGRLEPNDEAAVTAESYGVLEMLGQEPESAHEVTLAEQIMSPETLELGNAFNDVDGVPTAEEGGDESGDELLDGSPTVHNILLSPTKSIQSPIRSPSPMRSSPRRDARAAPRLSDDTTFLTDFLVRVKAQAAARTQDPTPSPKKSSSATPRRSPRTALGVLDVNSVSPSPARPDAKDTRDVRDARSARDARYHSANGSPVKRPKTPVAKLLLESQASSPETPDELGEPGEQSKPATDAATTTATTTTTATRAGGVRRSERSKAATQLPPPPSLGLGTPSLIPFRRLDGVSANGGEPVVLLQRSEAQRLAMATRANTRRNKGAARLPRSVLDALEARGQPPTPLKPGDAPVAANRKGRNVDWDQTLVYFLDEAKGGPGAGAKAAKQKTPAAKADRRARSAAGEPDKVELADAVAEVAADVAATMDDIKESRAPRSAKPSSSLSSSSRAAKALQEQPPEEVAVVHAGPVPEQAAPEGAAETTKPAAATTTTTTTRLRRLRPPVVNAKGTPAAKRTATAAIPDVPAALLSVAKRRVRRL